MDRDILEAARAGDSSAVESIYRELAPAVVGYLRGHGLRDPEDAASEVFVGMVRGLPRFVGDAGDFRTWLFSIAHRRMIDERRRRARRPEELVAPEAFSASLASSRTGDAEEEALAVVGTQWAVAAIHLLSPDQRAVVLLRVLADLSVEEVAAVLGKSPGAVKSLQRRGLIALSRALNPQGVS